MGLPAQDHTHRVFVSVTLSDILSDSLSDMSVLILLDFFQRVPDHREHEGGKNGGFALAVGGVQGFVITGLTLVNEGLHRQPGKNGLPALQNQRLPEAARASVAVGEGVNEFKFIMKNA